MALACSGELEQNSCRNRRLAPSIVLQPSWALGRERFLWSRAQGAGLSNGSALTHPGWRAVCGALLGSVPCSIPCKQLGWLAPGKEGCSSHSHHQNRSQEPATWQQLPGICYFVKLLTIGSAEEMGTDYSISTSLFPLGDPGVIFLLLSLPCWFCKSAACRQGPKYHLKISARRGDLFTLGLYGTSLPRDVFFPDVQSYVALCADTGLPLSISAKTDGK